MSLARHLDVRYLAASPLQTFDVYLPGCQSDTAAVLVCFIHGGAWRAEDKTDHAALAQSLAVSTGYPVAVPNYRLTPREPTLNDTLHHPEHAKDLLQFLEFILLWYEGNGGHLPRKPSKLFLVGHSCSAHMLCTVFLRMPSDQDGVCPSEELIRSTAAVIMSEGIYDIDMLLSSFPGYRTWFIENTFGKKDTFEHVSAFKATIDPESQHIAWFIIHSKGDALVDECQSEGMYNVLKDRSCRVTKSFDELEDGHNDILGTPRYVALISGYVKGLVGNQDESDTDAQRQ